MVAVTHGKLFHDNRFFYLLRLRPAGVGSPGVGIGWPAGPSGKERGLSRCLLLTDDVGSRWILGGGSCRLSWTALDVLTPEGVAVGWQGRRVKKRSR